MKSLLSSELNFYWLIWAFLIVKYNREHFWKSFNFSVSASKCCYPRQKVANISLAWCNFSIFDAIPHLHKVTDRNLTGNSPWDVSPNFPSISQKKSASMWQTVVKTCVQDTLLTYSHILRYPNFHFFWPILEINYCFVGWLCGGEK